MPPQNPSLDAAFAEAVRLHQAGEFLQAEAAYRAILQGAGAHPPTLCNLGVLLTKLGRGDEAVQSYTLALAASPDYPDAHFNLGNVHRRAGELALAVEHYQACLRSNPQHASAAFNLGLSYSQMGELEGAVAAFRLNVGLEPKNPEGHTRLGDVLARSGKLPEGIAAFRKGLSYQPNDHRALYNLGLALANANQMAEAQTVLQQALKLKPDYAEAHNAMGLNLEAAGRKDDAVFHYQTAVKLKPDLADAWSNLGTSLSEQGLADQAIDCLRKSLELRPESPAIHSNLLLMLNYSSRFTPEQVAKEHRGYGERYAPTAPAPPSVPKPHDATRPIRVGVVSSDFRQHTVSGFLELVLTHHDKRATEFYCYSTTTRPDGITQRLTPLAAQFRQVGVMPDRRLFEQMVADRLDILIDTNGHTAGNRMLLLAARPAPVCLTLFGYPNSTGLKSVDYRVTDAISDPYGKGEPLSVEKLLRLPEVPWVYAPPREPVAEVGPLPGLATRAFTVGCLNNPAKISEACLKAWATLIQSVAGSRLVLLSGTSQAAAKRLSDYFTRAGILRDRVEFLPRMGTADYFAAYGKLDLSLDPFPYNGGVTTGDSFYMGVPVVTVAGATYAGRQGVMANKALGLEEFTVQKPEELAACVKGWMARRPELAELRANLRSRLMSSPLGDAPRYVRNLEAALRKVFAERLAAQ